MRRLTACEHKTLLLPYQRAWVADDSLICVCDKSRRIGITWAEALRAVLVASSEAPRLEIVPGRWIAARQDVWYQVYSVDDGREFMEYVHEFALMHNAAMRSRGVRWDKLETGRDMLVRSLRFPHTRKRITVIAGKPRSWRNKGGVAIIDEAEFLDDLEGSISAVRPYLARGGRLRIMSSVGEAGSHMARLVEDITSGFKGSIDVTSNGDGTVLWAGHSAYHRYTLAHAAAQGCFRREFDRQRREWSPEAEAELIEVLYADPKADREYRCIRSRRGKGYIPGQWIDAARRDRPLFRWSFPVDMREVPRTREERDIRREDWRLATTAWLEPVIEAVADRRFAARAHYIAQDYASRAHTSAIGLVMEDNGTLDQRVTIELTGAPQEVQEQIVKAIASACPSIVAGGFDARGNGETHIERLRWSVGAHLTGYSQTEQWYRDTLPMLRRLFEEGRYLIPDDDDVAADFGQFELKANGAPTMGAPRGARHGDVGQVGAFAVRAWMDNPAPRFEPDLDPDDDDEDERHRY